MPVSRIRIITVKGCQHDTSPCPYQFKLAGVGRPPYDGWCSKLDKPVPEKGYLRDCPLKARKEKRNLRARRSPKVIQRKNPRRNPKRKNNPCFFLTTSKVYKFLMDIINTLKQK